MVDRGADDLAQWIPTVDDLVATPGGPQTSAPARTETGIASTEVVIVNTTGRSTSSPQPVNAAARSPRTTSPESTDPRYFAGSAVPIGVQQGSEVCAPIRR